jgi:hypothetical protein
MFNPDNGLAARSKLRDQIHDFMDFSLGKSCGHFVKQQQGGFGA